jgi:formylglycine-generating enzyme required for sulfatase activity
MSKQAFLVSFLISLSVFLASPLQAKRIALVIGNDEYANVDKLQKAVNDARAISKTIRDIGFEVIESLNANRRTFDQQLNNLNSKVEAGDEVLFFFAGHGISVRGRNYLLPIDIPKITPGQERSVTKEAFSEDEIISLLKERGAKVSLLIIDACRNNPFPKDGTRSVGRSVGLGQRSTPPRNTFVMYSAGFGQEALDRLSDDDQNPNSVFTRKLLPLLKTPGLSHIQMAKKLQIEVEQLALTTKSRHEQFPAFYDQVRGDFYLVPNEEISKSSIGKTAISSDEALWSTVENSKKASDFQFYLSKFPKGRYAAVAELKIKQLKETEVAIGIYPDKKPLTRRYKPGDTFKDCDECPEMVVVPPGEFMMGSPKSEKNRNKVEGPRHKVTIPKKFAVGQFEVTFDEWDACTADGGCNRYSPNDEGWGRGNLPVINVSWDDAKAYVRWLSRKTKKKYRLLSEAEWEYVARAKTNTPFWWGNSISTSQANYDGNYTYNGSKGKYRKKTVPVDSYEANDFGLYNVHGNVYEWVEDCWHKSYHGAPKDGTAWTTGGQCSSRVLRGGSWVSNPEYLRSAYRVWGVTDNRSGNLGFRVSRTLVAQVR